MIKIIYDTITITNIETGEVIRKEGTLMVAPNGMAFVKRGEEVVWCSASADFVTEKV